MRVFVKHKFWPEGNKEMDLSIALTPEYETAGSVETELGRTRLALEALGKVAALMVEKKVITIDEAMDACGIHGTEIQEIL